MKPTATTVTVHAWESEGILLEHYAYTVGAVEPLPKHSHEAYQFGVSLDCQGEYWYRGGRHVVPIGRLSVIHSGAVHAPSDRTFLAQPAHFTMAHLPPTWLMTVAEEMTEKRVEYPWFPEVIDDVYLTRLFLHLPARVNRLTLQLEKDTVLWNFLTHLLTHYNLNRPIIPPPKPMPKAIALTREYLHAHYTDNIALADLANIAGLSRFQVCRMFKQTFGLTPTVYQIQLRIDSAKKLLAKGISIAAVATSTGFYDQSHFGRYFKRLVGTTPAKYAVQSAISSYPSAPIVP